MPWPFLASRRAAFITTRSVLRVDGGMINSIWPPFINTTATVEDLPHENHRSKRPMHWAPIPERMRVESGAGLKLNRQMILVEVRTDEGVTGVGSPSGPYDLPCSSAPSRT